MHSLRWFLVLLLLPIAACNFQKSLESMAPEEDKQAAKNYISLLQDRKFGELKSAMGSTLTADPNLDASLTKMADLTPQDEPRSIKLVGYRWIRINSTSRGELVFEYEFASSWSVISVVIEHQDGVSKIMGMHVLPKKQSLEEENRFTWRNKSALHYAFIGAAVAVLIFSLISFVICLRTPRLPKKWLWAIATLVGVGNAGLSWTSGVWFFHPIYILLPTAMMSQQLYGPWIISVTLPLGAIIFLVKRSDLIQPEIITHPDAPLPPPPGE